MQKEAVRLVVDQGQPVLAVCKMFGLGPTALRRWVAAERERRSHPPGKAEQDKEMAALRKRVAQLEGEVEFLKKFDALLQNPPSGWSRKR
ncbi:transposase [Bacillus sp. NP157]|nr:transposase [Bacillus sp. NP157]